MVHLGDQLSAYVDRRLSPPVLRVWDRHVTVCTACRQLVDEERALLTSLRSASVPGVSSALHAMLLQLADSPPGMPLGSTPVRVSQGVPGPIPIPAAPSAPPTTGGGSDRGGFASPVASPIPIAPIPPSPLRLPTLAPSAPARHWSSRRAIGMVGLAAGASVWAIGLSAPVGASASATTSPVTRVPAPALRPAAGMLGLSGVVGPASLTRSPKPSSSHATIYHVEPTSR